MQDTGGAATVTLTSSQIPSHRHNYYHIAYNSSSYDAHIGGGSLYYWNLMGATQSTGYTGGGAAHDNMPPYLAVNIFQRV